MKNWRKVGERSLMMTDDEIGTICLELNNPTNSVIYTCMYVCIQENKYFQSNNLQEKKCWNEMQKRLVYQLQQQQQHQ